MIEGTDIRAVLRLEFRPGHLRRKQRICMDALNRHRRAAGRFHPALSGDRIVVNDSGHTDVATAPRNLKLGIVRRNDALNEESFA